MHSCVEVTRRLIHFAHCPHHEYYISIRLQDVGGHHLYKISEIFIPNRSMQLVQLAALGLFLVALQSTADAQLYCYDWQVRLVNQTTYSSSGNEIVGGQVEVCFDEVFYSVCTEGWDDSAAQVVCNSLGYTYYGNSKTTAIMYTLC